VINYSLGFQLALLVGLLLAFGWLVGTRHVQVLEVKGKNFLNYLKVTMELLAYAVLRTSPQKWTERQGVYFFPGRLQPCQLRPVLVRPTLHKELRRNP